MAVQTPQKKAAPPLVIVKALQWSFMHTQFLVPKSVVSSRSTSLVTLTRGRRVLAAVAIFDFQAFFERHRSDSNESFISKIVGSIFQSRQENLKETVLWKSQNDASKFKALKKLNIFAFVFF